MARGRRMRSHQRTKITTTKVEALKPGEVIGDTSLPGYFVRRQKDARVYFVRKYAHGRRHFVSIGEHGKAGLTERRARDRALAIIAALKDGRDPAVERAAAKSMPTLLEFAETFIVQRSTTLKEGTIANYRGLLRKHIAPTDTSGRISRTCLGRLKLNTVEHQHVAGLHAALKGTPRAANHVLDFLSSLYGEAQAAGLVSEASIRHDASGVTRSNTSTLFDGGRAGARW